MMEGFRQLQIEITNECNASCVFCPHRFMQRKIQHMTKDLIRKIVNEVRSKNLINPELPMGLCGLGEPFLHPEFKEVIDIVSEVPYAIGSNASVMIPAKIEKIFQKPFKTFTLSVDAATPEVYHKMRPGLNFNETQHNIENFVRYLRMSDTPFWKVIYFQFIVTEINQGDIYAFVDKWTKELEDIPNVFLSLKQICPWPVTPKTNGVNCLWPGPLLIQKIDHPKVVYGEFEKPRTFSKDCDLPFAWLQILSDGSYSICCMNTEDEYHLGNAYEMSLEEVWNSDKMLEYRRLFKEGRRKEIPFCSTCL